MGIVGGAIGKKERWNNTEMKLIAGDSHSCQFLTENA
jgi:hypothetical protein